ncbi:hypothetical protein AcV5_009187 [Taiwanofungus camphoratus]|nr:hypothetical protein AcV5_009187 [Antrodia cinnamomea]
MEAGSSKKSQKPTKPKPQPKPNSKRTGADDGDGDGDGAMPRSHHSLTGKVRPRPAARQIDRDRLCAALPVSLSAPCSRATALRGSLASGPDLPAKPLGHGDEHARVYMTSIHAYTSLGTREAHRRVPMAAQPKRRRSRAICEMKGQNTQRTRLYER